MALYKDNNFIPWCEAWTCIFPVKAYFIGWNIVQIYLRSFLFRRGQLEKERERKGV